MPTKGRPSFVRRAVKSVLAQTFTGFELIVLDNSPPKDKEEIQAICNIDPRVTFVERGDIGVTEARRRGAMMARGKLLSLLDSDDYWDARRLERHIDVWRRHSIGLSWDRWVEVDGENFRVFPQPVSERIIQPPALARQLFISNFIHASAGMVSSNFARKSGFPLLRIMSSDWVLFMRAAESHPSYFIGDSLSYKAEDSPDRVTDSESEGFFLHEATTIRRWALRNKPGIYLGSYLRKRVRGPVGRLMTRYRQTHEPSLMEVLRKMRGSLFVDVGANRGQFAIPLSRNFDRVIAVEPNPSLTPKGANVELVRCALSNNTGEVNLYLDQHPANPTWTLDTILDSFNYKPGYDRTVSHVIKGRKSIKVKTTTLDNLLSSFDKADLVKIDVEGAEFLVLEGAVDSLSNRKILNLAIEVHDRDDRGRMEALLVKNGFAFKWVDQDHIVGHLRQSN